MKFILKTFLLIQLVFTLNAQNVVRTNIYGPPGARDFGEQIWVLPNGNFVVLDPGYKPAGLGFATGAIHLFNGVTGEVISTLHGDHIGDHIGSAGITVLANGNFVVGSPGWGHDDEYQIGASTFCDADTGCSGQVSRSNSVVGMTQIDVVGGGGSVIPLTNGNYVLWTYYYDANGIADTGAVMLCDGDTGCEPGDLTPDRALVGSHANDQIGRYCYQGCFSGIVPLANGNFIVASPHWDGDRGAVTFMSGEINQPGVVDAKNSLVGNTQGELVGRGEVNKTGVHALANGKYVVSSSGWNGGRGASTLCSGATGCKGTISPANSLVGSNPGDKISSQGTVPLPNGNYVVVSPTWNGSRGAVTFASGSSGTTGAVNSANSLVGSDELDEIALGRVQVLPNGNYVVLSPQWGAWYGAVTVCNSASGCTGAVSAANSLVGTSVNDLVGDHGITVLATGDLVVNSPNWASESGVLKVGAVTWMSATTGSPGAVSSSNSITGTIANDRVGNYSVALTNGNYVVGSYEWDNGSNANVGAVTFCGNPAGCVFAVAPSNSIIGGNLNDGVGTGGVFALRNGNYVAVSYKWNGNRGAATFGNGTTGTVGVVGPSNSLVGTASNDKIGSRGVLPLTNGDYLVISEFWNGWKGAVTYGSGQTGIFGEITSQNSLVGTVNNDRVGYEYGGTAARPQTMALPDGGYTVGSQFWHLGSTPDVGAITFSLFDSPVTGIIRQENSFIGPDYTSGRKFRVAYNPIHKRLLISNTDANKIMMIYKASFSPRYDFDGDGKADVSIFRPNPSSLAGGPSPEGGNSQWWILKSSDLTGIGMTFGQPSDIPAPADFTGDGKTDVSFFRPSNGTWYVLRSEDQSFFAFPFGAAGDVPAPGDFDGDGRADPAVFRPSEGTWYILRSSDSGVTIVPFGVAEDIPQIADFDGDGRDDISLFRRSSGQWWQLRSTEGVKGYQFGEAQDFPVAGDYTGDGRADIAFFRQATFRWNILRSEDDSYYAFPWGFWNDIPVPADYDGDGVMDPAVFRPENNIWYIYRSSNGPQFLQFGSQGDVLLPGYIRQP